MPKMIRCDCGKIVRGDTEDELLANAEDHIRADHPAFVGKIAPRGFAAMAEDV